jgi:mannose-1-phosphate guanylyltransferase / mannose-6-phosphate isomerase
MSDREKFSAVILCGGSGTRLWPMSRSDTPKQFAIMIDGKSLFQRTYDRVIGHPALDRVVCLTHRNHRFEVRAVTGESEDRNTVILEPTSRNTAAAIACAALFAAREDPSTILACLPADHDIGEVERFHQSLSKAVHVASDGWLTVLSVVPREASTAFGYLLPGEQLSKKPYARRLKSFIEKPDPIHANEFIQAGYRWNSGMIVARADVLIDALKQHVPDLLASCTAALPDGQDEFRNINLEAKSFAACQNISFDHAVLEKHHRIAVVDLDAGWTDVGSWNEFAKFQPADGSGNRIAGEVLTRSCEESFIHSPDRLTVALGLKNLIVIDTRGALLVAERSKLAGLKDVVVDLVKEGRTEATSHCRVTRPWGAYECIDRGQGFQVKRITVRPGEALSLQYHNHRAEHWVVVKGQAVVTCSDRRFLLSENESTYIPKGAVHRLENHGNELLELIEVQFGTDLNEDDIVRLDDAYGRKGSEVS